MRVRHGIVNAMERVPFKPHVPHTGKVEIGKAGVDTLSPLHITVDTTEPVARDIQTVDEMPRTVRLDHQIAKAGRHLAGQKDIAGDVQRTEGKTTTEAGARVFLVGPFKKCVVDVVVCKDARGIRLGKNHASRPDTPVYCIALKKSDFRQSDGSAPS